MRKKINNVFFNIVHHKTLVFFIKKNLIADGITLKANGSNPVVGYPFELVCDTEANISNTVAIKIPDGSVVGSCDPAFPPIIPASCADAAGYDATLNELTHTVTLNINNLTSDVNGTWTCTHTSVTATWFLPAPVPGKCNVHVI